MNISRENLGELDLSIKIEVAENDYAEAVTKQLKEYQHKATVPGFRKGMAPMGLIQRMYKTAIVADEVQRVLSDSLYKYLEDEKLDIIGSPLSKDEKTGAVDFAKDSTFAFYFDAALMPHVDIKWDQVDVKLKQIKVSAKDVENQIDSITKRMGEVETPDTIGEKDFVYGKAVELDKEGKPVEGGFSSFISFDLNTVKNDEARALFVGHKTEDKVVFNAAKVFTSSEIEHQFHLDAAAAKKFKSDIEITISGCSRITPHELNEELFARVYPTQEVKDIETFQKLVAIDMDKANEESARYEFVGAVRKAITDQFDAPMPEAFLKRWILSRGEEKMTAESLEAEWNEKYVPSLKWEIIEGELSKIKPIEPTHNQIIDAIKDILRTTRKPEENESEQDYEKSLEEVANTIAKERKNVSQLVDKLFMENLFSIFNEQLKPEIEKVTMQEFSEANK